MATSTLARRPTSLLPLGNRVTPTSRYIRIFTSVALLATSTHEPSHRSNTDIMAYDPSSILSQPFNITGVDGALVEGATQDIQQLQQVATITAIFFATQLGLSAGVLAILLLTAESTKFRTPLLYINSAALICNIFRCALQCAFQTSALANYVLNLLALYDLPGVRNAQAIAEACTIFNLFLFILIEVSLVIQVNAIFTGVRLIYKRAVLGFVSTVALMAIAFRINLAIANFTVSAHLANVTQKEIDAQTWAQFVANVTSVISIGLISLIFVGKVGHAIHQRRKMGLKAFGSLQIVFIVGCQTLILPVIFAIVAYFTIHGVQLQSFVETFVAVFLPLSSIWSSANVKAQVPAGTRALLDLPTHGEARAHGRGSADSDISLTEMLGGRAPAQAGPVRSRRGMGVQHGSHDSVVGHELDIVSTARDDKPAVTTGLSSA